MSEAYVQDPSRRVLDPLPEDIFNLVYKIMVTENPSRLDIDLLCRWVLGLELTPQEIKRRKGYKYDPDQHHPG